MKILRNDRTTAALLVIAAGLGVLLANAAAHSSPLAPNATAQAD